MGEDESDEKLEEDLCAKLRNTGSITKGWMFIAKPSISSRGYPGSWKAGCDLVMSKISWTGHPLRSHSTSRRGTESTHPKIGAASLISTTAPRSNALPVSTFWWLKPG